MKWMSKLTLGSCLVLLLGLPAFAGDRRTPTIDELIGLPRPAAPVISPDGTFVAYTVRQPNWADNRYEYQVWLANTRTGKVTQLTNSKSTNNDPAWSPDGRWLSFVSNRDGKPQIYVVSPEGGEARQVTNVETGVAEYLWSPDGARIAFTMLDPEPEELKRRREKYSDFEVVRQEYTMTHLWVIDPSGGQSRRLTQGSQYTIGRFSWSPDGRRIAFEAKVAPTDTADPTTNLYVFSFDNNSTKQLISEAGPNRNPQWSPDGRQIAFETSLGRPNYFTQNIFVALVPAEGGPITNVTADFDERASLRAWAPDGIYFAAAQKTASYLFRVDPKTHVVEHVGPDDGAVYDGFTFTNDFRRVAFIEGDSTHYPEIYVSGLKTFAPKKLTDLGGQLKDYKLASREIIAWRNAEGATIEGVLMKPPGFDPSVRHPLLVVVHGGPAATSQAIWGYDLPYYPKEIWAAKGALILEPNYRGSDGYGTEFHRVIVGTVGSGHYDDIISGVDDLIAKGWVDKDRVGIMGWSYGGFISAWTSTNSDRFKAVSAGAATTDWALYDAWTTIQEISRQYLPGAPSSDPDTYRKSSPITSVARARTPTMIQHGKLDPIVPIAGAYELYQGLLDRGVPTRFYMYKGFGHSITAPKSSRAVMAHNLNWFNHYLWGEPDADAGH